MRVSILQGGFPSIGGVGSDGVVQVLRHAAGRTRSEQAAQSDARRKVSEEGVESTGNCVYISRALIGQSLESMC